MMSEELMIILVLVAFIGIVLVVVGSTWSWNNAPEEVKAKRRAETAAQNLQAKRYNMVSCPKCGELVELNTNVAGDALWSIFDPLFAIAKSKIRVPIECPKCCHRWLP